MAVRLAASPYDVRMAVLGALRHETRLWLCSSKYESTLTSQGAHSDRFDCSRKVLEESLASVMLGFLRSGTAQLGAFGSPVATPKCSIHEQRIPRSSVGDTLWAEDSQTVPNPIAFQC